MLPYHCIFDHLAIRVDGTTLFGQVTRSTLKTDAERAVDNQIEVLPLPPNDDRIRFEIWRAIDGHTARTRYNLQAVANQNDKNITGLQANGVAGVFSVANELRLDSVR